MSCQLVCECMIMQLSLWSHRELHETDRTGDILSESTTSDSFNCQDPPSISSTLKEIFLPFLMSEMSFLKPLSTWDPPGKVCWCCSGVPLWLHIDRCITWLHYSIKDGWSCADNVGFNIFVIFFQSDVAHKYGNLVYHRIVTQSY